MMVDLDKTKAVFAGLAVVFIVAICVAAICEIEFKAGAIAAYKQEIVCAYVPQLDRPGEWQCKEVEK